MFFFLLKMLMVSDNTYKAFEVLEILKFYF